LTAPVDVAALVYGVLFAMAVERWRRRGHVLEGFFIWSLYVLFLLDFSG
jgi:hypothetical protein